MNEAQAIVKPRIIVKVSESSVKQDKNGRNYKTITFRELSSSETIMDDILGPIQVTGSKTVETKINVYEQNYLNQTADWGYNNPLYVEGKPIPQGCATFGGIVQRSVKPYDIEVLDVIGLPTGEVRKVDSYKTAVLADSRKEEEFELATRVAFRNSGHPLTEADENLLKEQEARRAAKQSVDVNNLIGSTATPAGKVGG